MTKSSLYSNDLHSYLIAISIGHLWNVLEGEIFTIEVKPTNLQPACNAIVSMWTRNSKDCFQHCVEYSMNKAVLAKETPTQYLKAVPNNVPNDCISSQILNMNILTI